MSRIFIALTLWVTPLCLALDLGCQSVWTGPSNNNDLIACLRGRVATVDFWFSVSPALLLAAFAILTLVVYLPFFVIRQCCNGCGGRVMRPGTCCYGGEEWDDMQEEAATRYPPSRIRCFRVSAMFVLLGSAASAGLIVYGIIALPQLIADLQGSIRVNVIMYLQSLVTMVSTLTVGTPTFSFASLDASLASIRATVDQAEAQFNAVVAIVARYTRMGQIVLGVFSAIPFLTAALTVLLMCLRVRNIGPALCSCWTAGWAWVYFVAGTATMGLLTAALFSCGEYNLAETFRPGVVQWYAIPTCAAANPIVALTASSDAALRNLSQSACVEMLRICKNTSTFDAAAPSVAFRCGLSAEAAAGLCTSPRAVQAIVNDTADIRPGLCTSACSMATCPTRCLNETVRNATREIVEGVAYGVRVDDTLNALQPLLSCDSIVLRILAPLTKCSTVRNVVAVITVGCAWGGMMLVLLLCVQFKGQKWFLSDAEMGIAKS